MLGPYANAGISQTRPLVAGSCPHNAGASTAAASSRYSPVTSPPSVTCTIMQRDLERLSRAVKCYPENEMKRLVLLALAGCAALLAQGGDEKLAPFYPTPETVVEKMLQLGSLKAGEKMFDL